MNIDELKVSRIAAVNCGTYDRVFVYVETKPDEPTGLYPSGENDLNKQIETMGYSSEEYGLVDNQLKITRAEYDDGATVIDNRPINIRDRCELRVRYTSSYNFLIAPNDSPINSGNIDFELESFLNRILQGEDVFGELRSIIQRTPKRR